MKAATYCSANGIIPTIISIHAAREGGDLESLIHLREDFLFQSTPPVKAATCPAAVVPLAFAISIHAAREGGDSISIRTFRHAGISIHAAREGGDILQIAQ